ncbi:T9SS type A sorting domain-containing protein [Crocinitomix catalasitica]|nr:T9SS type A sorting domain-containing protein [Crocinitomix catalasitica]
MTGQRVYYTTINDQHNELVLRIDNYKPGFYLVQIISEKGDKLTKKLIVN